MSPLLRRGAVWYCRVPHPDGGSRVRGTGTTDKRTAARIDRAMQTLRHIKRWVILEAIHDKRCSLDEATDAVEMNTLDELEAQLADVNLEPYVAPWIETVQAKYGDGDTVKQYRAQVRKLIPAGEPFPRSRFTPAAISAWLYALPVSTGRRLRYYAAVSSFTKYLLRVGVLETSPLSRVDTPAESPKRDRYLEHADVLRLVAAQPYPFNVVSALLHSGMEAGVVPGITVRDVDPTTHTIRARGTKTARVAGNPRDRLVYVAEWAWGYVEDAMRGKLPDALLIDRPQAGMKEKSMQNAMYREHRAACRRLGIADYRQHDARHSYAVRLMASGAPAAVAAAQLGHTDEREVNERYGRFKPTLEDRARWERVAAARDTELAEARKRAQGGNG